MTHLAMIVVERASTAPPAAQNNPTNATVNANPRPKASCYVA
jgi:hypothetical protein